MLYHYLASDKTGKIFEGELDAGNVGEILEYLGGKELRPVSVEAIRAGKSLFSFLSKISIADKIFLTKYMSLMLKVGTDLLSAVDILIADFDKPAVKGLLLEIRENLTKGEPFHLSFERRPNDFDPVFVNLLKAAESSGNLQETFATLSISLEKESQLRSKIRSALIYPVIILTASLAIFIFLSTFALPKIAKVFFESGIQPPFFSRIVFTVGLFFGDHVFLILLGLVALVVLAYWFFVKNPVGRRMWQEVINHTPVLRQIQKELAIQRFAATFSSLMKAGLPIVESLHLTAGVVSTEQFKNSLMRVADDGLSRGLTIGEAFRRETVFPKVISNLIAISEKAGHLDEILGTIADFYADNVDTSIKSLISVLEPLLLFAMGLLVGLIALSIIVPIYQLTSQF
jgi:type II secretory pathway component PulF